MADSNRLRSTPRQPQRRRLPRSGSAVPQRYFYGSRASLGCDRVRRYRQPDGPVSRSCRPQACGRCQPYSVKAQAFAEQYGIEKVYETVEDLYADPNIDAVYITTPHNTHITYLRAALAAGKHVLCEKAITLNSAELDEARAIADEHNVVLMDATTVLHMPLYQELRRRMDAGDFGRMNLAQLNFGS